MLRQTPVAPVIGLQACNIFLQDAAQYLQDAEILRLRAAPVPQTQGADHPALRQCKAAVRRLRDVVLKPIAAAVALEGVEGDADLVQRGTAPQQRQPVRQQGAVGGETDPESQVPADAEDLRQLRVQQRLPHDVEVEVVRMAAQLARQQGKRLRGHKALFPGGAGAEGAGHIAHVGDLHIGAAEHGADPSSPVFTVRQCTTNEAV